MPDDDLKNANSTVVGGYLALPKRKWMILLLLAVPVILSGLAFYQGREVPDVVSTPTPNGTMAWQSSEQLERHLNKIDYYLSRLLVRTHRSGH